MSPDVKPDDLVRRDAECLWHPYAAPVLNPPPVAVHSAEGVRLKLSDGRELVDGMSSWWSAIHGYNHPALNRAVQEQLGRMSHVMFGGLTHEPAVALAEQLCALAPGGMERVFFSDSGSVAVEVAIKLALQYWQACGETQRTRLLTVRGGYHGDTFGAMSVCDPVTGMHGLFRGSVQEHLFAPRPSPAFGSPCTPADLAALTSLIEENGSQIAAIILEPIVQGAGGMWFYSAEYLAAVRRLCDAHGVLLIVDEIATGFGRTGTFFACEHANIGADIFCVGKALTGGMMSLGATLVSPRVCEGIGAGKPGVFMHGPTFMANPLSCHVARANLELLATGEWRTQVAAIESQLKLELKACRDLPGVADVRVLGAIGVVELESPLDLAVAQPEFVERGVWVRPFGKLVYVMPPYVVQPADLSLLTSAIVDVVGAAT